MKTEGKYYYYCQTLASAGENNLQY